LLELFALPVPLKYMVYYIREALNVQIGPNDRILCTQWKKIDLEEFKEKMTQLEDKLAE